MQVRSSKLGVAHYLTPDGPLVADNLPAIDAPVRQILTERASRIVLDLRHVPFFDSSGLEYLLDLADRLREEGGSLRLANPNPLCREVLGISGLDETIPIHENLASAGRSFL
ncbi:MAG: STAS domain-containing protein [Candidatus Eisenbacteria bacterium]